jgi:hypothetical protein
MNGILQRCWRAVCLETRTYGSEGSAVKPNVAMHQGARRLPYYNFQRHMAHENRDDGCHSPAAVLQWIKGVQPEPELVYQAFSAMCETRRLNKAGYARFRNFLLSGERNLAGEKEKARYFSRCADPGLQSGAALTVLGGMAT